MLSSPERQALKARAHKLNPVVHIGAKGLTDDVVAEIDRALKAHELIKVRAVGLERDARSAALTSICERTGAQAVQQVGKVFVLYRKNDEQT
jgi:RNA-binding protein